MFADWRQDGEESQDETEECPQHFQILVMARTRNGIPVRPQGHEAKANRKKPAEKETGYQ